VPSTLGALFDKARRETEKIKALSPGSVDVNRQLCQLAEAFGQMKYMQAAPLLRECIPKNSPFRRELRGAAIWSLGHLYADKEEPELVGLLVERLSDVNPMFPEAEEVRQMSAVSLGRMKAEASLPALRRFLKEQTPNDPVGYCCGWAVHQITGEPIPEPKLEEKSQTGWFLEPVED
jgi:HEAT repeat protein